MNEAYLQTLVREAVGEVLDQRARIDQETHADHHAWIQAKIEAEKERAEAWRDIRRTALGWAVTAVLGAALAWFAGAFGWKVGGGQ
ncbi:hypothetical protein SAMN02949497_3415 [Methylomagnum ishizawai]|uniref:Uncharacterized protein n=1 Tax=Methylomagnum ishizawai TaxID=1760988 RepID=A0A1Y6D895_9GAMM|nr:hypothetical protein [Methylomagnum ishizawai]SMF96035.1 hypothetical protein SAMN02949497_3415 [Methylomagnum ishizawai]